MRELRWIRFLLSLLLAVATSLGESPPSLYNKRDSEEISERHEDIKNTPGDAILPLDIAESQQISVVAPYDLDASASGYDKGYGKGASHIDHKGYKGGYHSDEGYKGKKGHKDDKGYKKSHYGDYGKDHKKGYHDKGGKYYKGHDDKHKYYGDEHKGKKGKKGHHYGSKGHHNKGHKDKGFKNVYHKEEYHHQKKYYDDFDNNKYHNKYDDFDSYFTAHKGKDYKGGHYKKKLSDTINTSSKNMEKHFDESLVISRVAAAIEKINATIANSKYDIQTESSVYIGRVLLDTSSQRMRYPNTNQYDSQCHVQDLRMIKKYLRNCNIFLSKHGWQEDGTPSCNHEDIMKIKRYLELCQRSFFKRASHRDKKEYEKQVALAHKLEMMSYPDGDSEEAHYVIEDVCKVDDLKQMQLYLQDCSSGKDDHDENDRPACDLPNFEKSLDYLSACKSAFLARASRKDIKRYSNLVSTVMTLIKRETSQTAAIKHEDTEDSQTTCTMDDLKESQNYIEECESLLLTATYQREYGSQMCRRKYMRKVHKFLSSCEHLVRNAPSKDKKKFRDLLAISAKLSEKPGKEPKYKSYTKTDMEEEHPDCNVQDLRSIPKYLRACYKSKSCASEQLLEVHEFLVMCEENFIRYASPRDRKKYKDLVLMSDMLNTNQLLQKEKRDRDDEEHMEAICKVQILRKVPKYLKDCFQSGNCKSKQLLKVIKFLSLCEEFFSIAFSPKDRGKYKELKDIAEELLSNANNQDKEGKKGKGDSKSIDCSLKDLRKIPRYLAKCKARRNCKHEQLYKIYQFLFYCEIPFTRSASSRDKTKYKEFMALSEKLNTNRKGEARIKKSRNYGKFKCQISELKKIPKYIKSCTKFKNCNLSQLKKIINYLNICRDFFFKKASRAEKRKYEKLSSTVENLYKNFNDIITEQPICKVVDLRKIPKCLIQCSKTKRCNQSELRKITNFLKSCRTGFLSRASRTDQEKYTKLLSDAEKLCRNFSQKVKSHSFSCQINDLRKISPYLNLCSKSQNCNQRQLTKVLRFLTQCRSNFLRQTTSRDKKKYIFISKLAKKLVESQPIKTRRVQKLRRKVLHSRCKIIDLKKIPTFLQNCTHNRKCTKKQIMRVERFLVSCKTHFAGQASSRDSRIYGNLIKLSKRSISKDERNPISQSTCQVKTLRSIYKNLLDCSKKTIQIRHVRGICKRASIVKMERYLYTCQKTFLLKASSRDRAKYRELLRLPEKLKQGFSGGKKRNFTKGDANRPGCQIRTLRRVSQILTYCSTDGKRKEACSRKNIKKLSDFLASCKNYFYKLATSTDKKKYQRLENTAKTLCQRLISKDKRQIKKLAAKRNPRCSLHSLRKINKQLMMCSRAFFVGKIYIARGKRNENEFCKNPEMKRVENYLKSCQSTFLKHASQQDKKKYKSLLMQSKRLSSQLSHVHTKFNKKMKGYNCSQQSMKELEKHYNYCRMLGKSQMRRGRSSVAQKRYKRYKLKTMRRERQYSKTKSFPARRQGRTVRKEHGRRHQHRRAKRKIRQGGKHHDKHGKKGHHEKGKYHDDHKGHKGHYDHKGHYGHKSSYGKKGGHKGDYGHKDHKGYGHDDHHGGGYGHYDDHHHGGGYGHHGDHHGGGYGHDHHGHGYGHDDHGGYGSHSNVQLVSTPKKYGAPAPVYSIPGPSYPSGPAPVYVPVQLAANTKVSSTSGFYPSPELVVPPLIVPPVAASSHLPRASSATSAAGIFSNFSPAKSSHTFESFGDFGQFS